MSGIVAEVMRWKRRDSIPPGDWTASLKEGGGREERKTGDWEGRRRERVEERDARKRPTAP